MGQLLNFRNAVVNTLRADARLQSPALWVGKHPGKWDYSEMKRYAARTPAILFTPMGGEISKVPMPSFEISMAGVLMCEDKPGNDREEQILCFSDLIMRILSSPFVNTSLWGLTNAINKPHSIAVRNMFSKEADKDGVLMWCVVWKQNFDLTDSTSADSPVPMAGYSANWFEPTLKGADYDGTEASLGKGAEPYARDEQDLPETE